MTDEVFPRTRQELDDLIVLDQVDSTNTWLRSSEQPGWVAVASWNQTAGRGRAGRTWLSPAGQSLAFSLRLPALPLDSVGWIPLLAGTVLVETLQEMGLGGVGMKWPNDVQVGEAKLAGILTERLPSGDSVVGLGLNVFGSPQNLEGRDATSLLESGLDAAALVDPLLAAWCRGMKQAHSLVEAGERDAISSRVSGVMTTLGREVRVESPEGQVRTGRALSLHANGGLLVAWADGTGESVLLAGDVWHLRAVDAATPD